MSKRPRKKDEELEGFHPDERWAVSYLDMVTVLMCMFIVLFAMSSPDAEKYEKLKNSLASGFGQEEKGMVDTAEGIVLPPGMEEGDQIGMTALEKAMAEVDELAGIEARIKARLKEKGLDDTVEFFKDGTGLTVRMVSSDTFFLPDEADLTGTAAEVLEAVAPELKTSKRDTAVQGHTAKLPDDRFVRDWELSSERAVNVVRHLTGELRVPGGQMEATGYGETRPLAKGTSPADLKLNRRVDIVLKSDEDQAVRDLMPEVIDKKAGNPAQAAGH